MKTRVQIILIGLCLLKVSFIMGKENAAGRNKPLQEPYEIGLIIYGKVLNNGIILRSIEFRLYEGNDLVVNGNLDRRGEFELPLYANQNYVLEINADGYLPKRFYFNTSIPQGEQKLYTFGFFVSLLPEERVKGADIFSLDFPYAIVSYNKETSAFDFSEKYSEEMRSEEMNALNGSLR